MLAGTRQRDGVTSSQVACEIQELWWIKAGDTETVTLILDALWSVVVSGGLVWPAAAKTSG